MVSKTESGTPFVPFDVKGRAKENQGKILPQGSQKIVLK